MKKTIIFFLTFIMVFPAFASWEIGKVMDEFGDPTGESFIYYLTNGTFSNSATSSSDCYVRVHPEFEYKPFAQINSWTFDIHNYNWDQPLISYSGTPIYRVKDDSGMIYSFGKKYTAYTPWNCLFSNEAKDFTELLKNNENLKLVAYIGNTTYRFNIDCSNFSEILTEYKKSMNPDIGNWNEIIMTKDDYEVSYLLASITGDTPKNASRKYEKYELFNFDGKEYICYYRLERNADYQDELELTIKLYYLDENSETVSTTKIKEIIFIGNDGKKTTVENDNTDYFPVPKGVVVEEYYNNKNSLNNTLDIIRNGEAYIKFVFMDGSFIGYTTDGKDFYAYAIKAKQADWL